MMHRQQNVKLLHKNFQKSKLCYYIMGVYSARYPSIFLYKA